MLRMRPTHVRDDRYRLMVALATIRVAEFVGPFKSAISGLSCTPATAFRSPAGRPPSTWLGENTTASGRDTSLQWAGPRTRTWIWSTSSKSGCANTDSKSLRSVRSLRIWQHPIMSALPPLFSRLGNGSACRPIPTAEHLSVQMFGDSLRRVLAARGADTQRFSGISARKGPVHRYRGRHFRGHPVSGPGSGRSQLHALAGPTQSVRHFSRLWSVIGILPHPLDSGRQKGEKMDGSHNPEQPRTCEDCILVRKEVIIDQLASLHSRM
jgi:hypothetical protein